MRTYRHNNDRARGLEPERCECCHELPIVFAVSVTASVWSESLHEVCDECLPGLEQVLKQREMAYRVGLASS